MNGMNKKLDKLIADMNDMNKKLDKLMEKVDCLAKGAPNTEPSNHEPYISEAPTP